MVTSTGNAIPVLHTARLQLVPDNHASRRVALAIGATAAETIDFLGSPMQVYRYRRAS